VGGAAAADAARLRKQGDMLREYAEAAQARVRAAAEREKAEIRAEWAAKREALLALAASAAAAAGGNK